MFGPLRDTQHPTQNLATNWPGSYHSSKLKETPLQSIVPEFAKRSIVRAQFPGPFHVVSRSVPHSRRQVRLACRDSVVNHVIDHLEIRDGAVLQRRRCLPGMDAPGRRRIRHMNHVRDQTGFHLPVEVADGTQAARKVADLRKNGPAEKDLSDREYRVLSRQLEQTIVGSVPDVRNLQKLRSAIRENGAFWPGQTSQPFSVFINND